MRDLDELAVSMINDQKWVCLGMENSGAVSENCDMEQKMGGQLKNKTKNYSRWNYILGN